MGEVDQIMLAREPRKGRANGWGSHFLSSAARSTTDNLIYIRARGLCRPGADERGGRRGETRGRITADLRIDVGVAGSMLECAFRIVLGISE